MDIIRKNEKIKKIFFNGNSTIKINTSADIKPISILRVTAAIITAKETSKADNGA